MKEPFLEPILRKIRIRKVLPVIKKYPGCRLLDIGCGWDYKLLKTVEPYITRGVGVDFKAKQSTSQKTKTFQTKLTTTLPFEDNSFDVVTMLAVLEHLSYPGEIIKEIERLLVSGGSFILTVPAKLSKPVLEFLSYQLKIINEEEIKDHKKYYDFFELKDLFEKTKLKIETHRYFQFGLNNFCIARKY